MGDYHPISSAPVTFSAGVWKAPLRPNRTVTVSFDPRLLAWLVRQAARRESLAYSIAQGKPPITITLT